MARLLPLAHFGGRAALSRSWGYFAAHLRTLIWGLSFIKCFFSIFSPENASQISFSISEETAPPTDPGQQPPKRASGNERAMKKGGRGSSPATLCVRAFSRESLDPPPGTGWEPTLQVWTCAGPNPDHLPGAARCCVPSGGVPPKPPWGAAPRCPPGPGRGPGFLWKKAGGKNTRAPPWTRVLMAARSHSLGLGMVASGPFEVLFPPIYQDRFGTHFRGKICWKAFLRKKVSKSGHVHGLQNRRTNAPLRPTTPKRASANERAIKRGAGGHPPRLFASGLSLEKAWIPRPGPGGNPRCRVHPAPVPAGPAAENNPGPPSAAWHGPPFYRGKKREKVLPAPGAESTRTYPPWPAAICRTRYRPMPTPAWSWTAGDR